MLILNYQDVIYCQLIRPSLGKFKPLPGLAYHNRLFYQLESYSNTEYTSAVKRARELFDRAEQRLVFLLVEEQDACTIWCEDHQLMTLQEFQAKKEDFFENYLKNILEDMCQVGGISLKTHRLNSQVYSKCFVGCEAVAWLTDNLKIAIPEAVQLGQRLIDEKLVHQIENKHIFKNDNLLYRFYGDEAIK
jgi:hypothetical protein